MKQNQQDKIWEYYQNEGIDKFVTNYPRLKFLSKHCKGKILDIGVGNRLLEHLLKKQNKEIFALDPNKRAVEKTGEIIGKNNVKVGYSTQIPYDDNTFDTVVMSQVLEHMSKDDLKKTLKEVKRVLKIGGQFIGTVPSNENLKVSQVLCPYCGEKFHKVGHQQSFTDKSFSLKLSSEFSNVTVKVKLFLDYNRLNIKGKIGGVIKYLLFILGIHGSNENIFFKGIK